MNKKANAARLNVCWQREQTAIEADDNYEPFEICAMPLHERRKHLESLLSGNDALWFSSHVEGVKRRGSVPACLRDGPGGIVSKRIDTPYRSGPFLGLRKIKCPGYARPRAMRTYLPPPSDTR